MVVLKETISASAYQILKHMAEPRDKLKNFIMEDVFDVDEASLYFKPIPKKIYICDFKSRESVQ